MFKIFFKNSKLLVAWDRILTTRQVKRSHLSTSLQHCLVPPHDGEGPCKWLGDGLSGYRELPQKRIMADIRRRRSYHSLSGWAIWRSSGTGRKVPWVFGALFLEQAIHEPTWTQLHTILNSSAWIEKYWEAWRERSLTEIESTAANNKVLSLFQWYGVFLPTFLGIQNIFASSSLFLLGIHNADF